MSAPRAASSGLPRSRRRRAPNRCGAAYDMESVRDTTSSTSRTRSGRPGACRSRGAPNRVRASTSSWRSSLNEETRRTPDLRSGPRYLVESASMSSCGTGGTPSGGPAARTGVMTDETRPTGLERVEDLLGDGGAVGAVEGLPEAHHPKRVQAESRQVGGRATDEVDRDPGRRSVSLRLGQHVRVGLQQRGAGEERSELDAEGARSTADVEEVTGAVEAELVAEQVGQRRRVRRAAAEVVGSRPEELGRVVVHVPQAGVEPATFRLGGGCSIH